MDYCYARINLLDTNYSKLTDYKIISQPDIVQLNDLYYNYCRYKKFKSVMPIFDNEYMDNDLIGYYHNNELIAFSLIKIHDNENVEAIQFAWNYKNPELHLGIASLRHECAIYKEQGYKYFYLGYADEYKKQMDGFEILGSV